MTVVTMYFSLSEYLICYFDTLQELRLDGTIRTTGLSGTSYHGGSGSGGSIRMTLGSLKGYGTASANGGASYSCKIYAEY